MARLPQSFDEAFNSIHAVLVEQLHVSTSLLNRFLDSNLLNQHHVDELKVILVQHDRADRLLSILQRADDTKVDVFLRCLCDCRQQDVCSLIVHRDNEAFEQRRGRRKNLQEKNDNLIKYVEPDFEILNSLYAKDVFSTEVIDAIKAEKTKGERNEKMLFHLRYADEKDYESFLNALRDSSQTHVVDFIDDNKVGDDWPLTTTQLTDLKSKYSHLVQFLDIDTDMLRRLSQCGCITQEQMNWLSRKHLEKRNRAMLDILKRRSQRSLQQFIACLNRTTRNSRAIQILEHAEDCYLGILAKALSLHNRPKLVKLLNVSHNLLRQLVANSCMTSEQMNSVVSKPTPEDKKRALFDVLEQQGFKSSEQIIKCFKDSGENDALLWVLEHEGVVAECAIELNAENVKVPRDEAETLVCREYFFTNAVLRSDIQLIAFKKFNGRFSAFVMNRNREDLARLVEWYLCGKLKEFLEPVVNGIDNGVRIKSINWTVKDFDRCNRYFLVSERLQVPNTPSSSLSHTPPSMDFSKVTIDDVNEAGLYPSSQIDQSYCSVHQLTIDLVQKIMIKSIGVMFGKLAELKYMYRDAVTESLISVNCVCHSWWNVLTGRTTNRRRLRLLLDHICRPYRRVVHQQGSLKFREVVMGVAILRSKMFIIFDYSPIVRVYHSDFTDMLLEEIDIPGMQYPHDIVACGKTEKLYIADMQNSHAGCIWRSAAEGGFHVYLPSSQQPEGLWPRSLAAANGHLLVVSHPNVLLVYGLGGRRVSKVELPRDMEVQHAVATDHDTFVVSLSKAMNSLVLLREFDLHGNPVRVCSVEFNLPVHLAVDRSGHVLVADRYDQKVVVLDRRLGLKRVLLAEDENLKEPRRLLLPPELSQLYVCELHNVSLWVVGMHQS